MTTVQQFGMVYPAALKLAPSMGSKAVYSALTVFAHAETREAFPKHETLAEMLGTSVRSIERYIAELKKVGLISIVGFKKNRNGYKSANVYKLLESHPTDVAGNNVAEDDSPAKSGKSHPPRLAGQEQTILKQTITTTTNNSYVSTVTDLPDTKKVVGKSPAKPRPKVKARKATLLRPTSVPKVLKKRMANGIDVVEFLSANGPSDIKAISSAFNNDLNDLMMLLNTRTKNGSLSFSDDMWSCK